MRTIEQNGLPSIQQIVFVEDKALKQDCINKLFKKTPQRCFQTAQLRKNETLMKHQIFSCLVNELERWNRKIQNNEHDVDSRRQLTRNTFLFTGLKRIINIQQNRKSQQLTKLYDWFQKFAEYPHLSAKARTYKKKYDDAWSVRKTFKHNMQAQINSYRRRLLVSAQNQATRSVQHNSKINKNDSHEVILFTEPTQAQQRFNFDHLKIYHNRVRKNRQFGDISQAQNRFSQQKSRCNQHRYKNFWDGKFRPDDIWQTKVKVPAKTQKIVNAQSQIQEIKRRRIFQILSQNKLNRFSQNKDQALLTIRSIDGCNLIKNPFDVPLKKKKRR